MQSFDNIRRILQQALPDNTQSRPDDAYDLLSPSELCRENDIGQNDRTGPGWREEEGVSVPTSSVSSPSGIETVTLLATCDQSYHGLSFQQLQQPHKQQSHRSSSSSSTHDPPLIPTPGSCGLCSVTSAAFRSAATHRQPLASTFCGFFSSQEKDCHCDDRSESETDSDASDSGDDSSTSDTDGTEEGAEEEEMEDQEEEDEGAPSQPLFLATGSPAEPQQLLVTLFSNVWRLYAENDLLLTPAERRHSMTPILHDPYPVVAGGSRSGSTLVRTPPPYLGEAGILGNGKLGADDEGAGGAAVLGPGRGDDDQHQGDAGLTSLTIELGDDRLLYMLAITDPFLKRWLLALTKRKEEADRGAVKDIDLNNSHMGLNGTSSAHVVPVQRSPAMASSASYKTNTPQHPPSSSSSHLNELNTVLLCITADTSQAEIGFVTMKAKTIIAELEYLLLYGVLREDRPPTTAMNDISTARGGGSGDLMMVEGSGDVTDTGTRKSRGSSSSLSRPSGEDLIMLNAPGGLRSGGCYCPPRQSSNEEFEC